MLKSAAIVILLSVVVGVQSDFRRARSLPDGALTSLTPLISSGNIAEAQKAARVDPPLFSVQSYAHFFTVNAKYNSNIFFWYFPVTTADPNAPLILWLQGGPGTSSLLGLFAENGPVSIDANLTAIPRDFAWNKRYNMVYFDNPVGAGFSYTENDKGYANNMDDVGINLYSALIQFLTLFPDLQKKPFFLAGESYAGKYIPTLGHYIHKNNPSAALKVNLVGMSIGNGFSDPPLLMDFSNHLFQLGLIDRAGKVQFEVMEAEIEAHIAVGQWEKATTVFGTMIAGFPNSDFSPLFRNLTGFNNIYNFLQQDEPPRYWLDFVNQPSVKNALHIYDRSYNHGAVVKEHFYTEMLKGVKPWIEELLTAYRVIIYTGQLDCLIPPKQVHDYMNTLVFPGMIEYQLSHRSKWMVNGMIGGYVKSGGLLTDLVVRDAGHMVPQDQPELAWDLIDRFVNNRNFSDRP